VASTDSGRPKPPAISSEARPWHAARHMRIARPGDADLARADAGDGPVGDARARVVAGGGFGGQGDAVAVGDRSQKGVGLVGDGSDADRVALPLVGGQPVIARRR
jgi:hypothetical protein